MSFDHRTAQRRKPGRLERHRRQPFGYRPYIDYPRAQRRRHWPELQRQLLIKMSQEPGNLVYRGGPTIQEIREGVQELHDSIGKRSPTIDLTFPEAYAAGDSLLDLHNE